MEVIDISINIGIHILTSVDKSSVPSSYLHDNG